MACGCCKTSSGCRCMIPGGGDGGTTPNPNMVFPFTYTFTYKMSPWINRTYPEPIFMAKWDRKIMQFLASNHVIDNVTGRLKYQGNISFASSRRGQPAGRDRTFGGWYIEDGDGDYSGPYRKTPPGNVPPLAATVFELEEKQDVDKRECQLWVKFKRITPILDQNGNQTGYEQGPWGELELLHSMSWDAFFPAQLIIEIPGDRFNGPNSVELRYHCIGACDAVQFSSLEVTGQAGWVNKSTIEFPLNYCKSYGSYDGNFTYSYKNCNGQGGLFDTITNNRSKNIYVTSQRSCGYNYGFTITFFGYGGSLCQGVPLPCNPPYNDLYYCCGNVYGGYTKQPDGTESCSYHNGITVWSSYYDDVHNRDLIDSKTVIYHGVFMNAVENCTRTYDCATYRGEADPSWEYKLGSVVATGV